MTTTRHSTCGLVEISSQAVEKLRELFDKEVNAGTFTGGLKTRLAEILETMELHMQESDGWVKYYCF